MSVILNKMRHALREWMGECYFSAKGFMPDGVTPRMGKHETEELYKIGTQFLAEFVPPPEGFEWINKPATITGEDFSYQAQVLCSFPKLNGKVRYVVEDNNRLFIQRDAQIIYHTRSKAPEDYRKNQPKDAANYVCPICDGGPGNSCACTCPKNDEVFMEKTDRVGPLEVRSRIYKEKDETTRSKPLTPAQIDARNSLSLMLEKAKQAMLEMTPEQLEKMWAEQRISWSKQDMD